MTPELKEFIEKHITLIEKNEWEKVYEELLENYPVSIATLTECMLEAGIHPEYYLQELPDYFLQRSDVEEINIPNNITAIGAYAFHGCTNLTTVVIPSSVTRIGRQAFGKCINLKTISILGKLPHMSEAAFIACGNPLTINYNGNKSDWDLGPAAIRDVFRCRKLIINCKDGQIIKNSETH